MGTPFSRNNEASDGSTISAKCPQFVVRVATCVPNADPTQDPTWNDFQEYGNLEVTELFFGSSLAGMSNAKVRLVAGAPVAIVPGQYIQAQRDQGSQLIEQIDPMSHGDRVIISLRTGSGSTDDEPRFGGYVTGGTITVDAGVESLHYQIAGPEWIWGDDSRNGSNSPVFGQIRRTSAADDAAAAGTPTTDVTQIVQFSNYPAVFNPNSRKNMTEQDVILSPPGYTGDGSPAIQGRVWEIPDRQQAGANASVAWNTFQAARTLFTFFNDPNKTGINDPDWPHLGLDDSHALKETNVDGMGLWSALRAVCAPDWNFAIDPTPSAPDQWGGFAIGFFQRGTGSIANFTLNPPATPIEDADASLVRIQAAKDTHASPNSVLVLGSAARHLQLTYNGGNTPTLAGTAKSLALQHGWGQTEDKISNYAANSAESGFSEVSAVTIASLGSTVDAKWKSRYRADGPEYSQFSHIFRLFTWNEANEYTPGNATTGTPVYGPSSTALDWYAPDLTGIADQTGFSTNPGTYCRRRRRLLDTMYLDSTATIDGWRRVRATLYASAIGVTTTNQGQWCRVPPQFYRIDHERAAVWITARDVAEWLPLMDVPDPDEPTLNDYRSFATLLHTGKLRLLVEASIDVDQGLMANAPRQATAGSPLVRQIVVRNQNDFIQSIALAGLVATPSGCTATPVDTSADALEYATQLRTTLERQQVHASVLACADWPEQSIGSIINGTQGRQINLQSGGNNNGPGAQIVAKIADIGAMAWEYLTESRAPELRARARRTAGQPIKRAYGAAPVHGTASPTVISGMRGEVPGGDRTDFA